MNLADRYSKIELAYRAHRIPLSSGSQNGAPNVLLLRAPSLKKPLRKGGKISRHEDL